MDKNYAEWLIKTNGCIENNLTVRDYFAGQALIHFNLGDGIGLAEKCYEMADLMLKARNAGEKEK